MNISMQEAIAQYGWHIFVGIDLIVFLVVIYFIKERNENKRIQSMQTDQVPLENRTNEKNEVTAVFQEKKKKSPLKKSTVLDASGSFSGFTWTSKGKGEVVITNKIIEQMKSYHMLNPFIKKLVLRFFPEKLLNKLVEKALKGELEPGMKAEFRDGQLYINDQLS